MTEQPHRQGESEAMSAVIEFPADRVRPVSQTATAGAKEAEVIIFPGVRVERLTFDLAERLAVKRTGASAGAHAKELDFY
jgi:hypothetical protein